MQTDKNKIEKSLAQMITASQVITAYATTTTIDNTRGLQKVTPLK
jgi:hypothetical protein